MKRDVRVAGKLVLVSAALLGAVGCAEDGIFTEDEWARVESLGAPLPALRDDSNRFVGDGTAINAEAVALGHKFYFDTGFSGKSNLKDMLGRTQAGGRAPAGMDSGLNCKTCHDPAQGGSDHTSPGNVSFGAGFYDVNSQQTPNSGHYGMIYWNGRVDSLWAQIVAVAESGVSMNGTRLKTAWRIAEAYSTEWAALPEAPAIPVELTVGVAAQKARLNTDGTCILDPGDICPTYCRAVTPAEGASVPGTAIGGNCFPKFPLQGKAGTKAGCQPLDAAEPFGDAFDCMDAADAKAITAIYVTFTKAIAAYEFSLSSHNSAFDRYVAGDETAMTEAQVRGLKLFVGKASCIDCHSGPMFSDAAGPESYGTRDQLRAGVAPGFHNIGIPQTGPFVPSEGDCVDGSACDCVSSEVDPEDPTKGPAKNCLPWGLWDGLQKLRTNTMRRDKSWSDVYDASVDPPTSSDATRAAWYFKADDTTTPDVNESLEDPIPAAFKGQWRTPSLRDVALTAPYMHTGVYDTLWDVVDHYNFGGAAGGPTVGEKDPRLKPLFLTDAEIADLVEFLGALTSTLPADTDETRGLYFAPSGIPAASPF